MRNVSYTLSSGCRRAPSAGVHAASPPSFTMRRAVWVPNFANSRGAVSRHEPTSLRVARNVVALAEQSTPTHALLALPDITGLRILAVITGSTAHMLH